MLATKFGQRWRRARAWLLIGLTFPLAACGAVYPEVKTPLHAVSAGAALDPPPPDDVIYIEVMRAQIPEKTRDGQQWDAVGGNLPDPYLILFNDDVEVFRTPVQPNTLQPTWPDAAKANYRIPLRSGLRMELWDSNTLTHRPICVHVIDDIHQQAGYGFLEVQCESGANVSFKIEHARALVGLGLIYELRSQAVFVTRVLAESPAGRSGIASGDELVSIETQPLSGKDAGTIRSLINSNARTGMSLVLRRGNGTTETVVLKEGPVYPLVEEGVPLQ